MTGGLPQAGLRGFLRFLTAAVLLATAAGKLLDVRGFAAVLRTYDFFGEGALLPLAIGVPALELGLALWLLSARRLAGAALGSAALHVAYALWSAVSVLRGLKLSNCGCFGVFLARPLSWQTVAEDGGMAALSLTLWALARRRE